MLIIGSTVLTVNGIELWVEVQGKGLPFVLCHGGPGAYDYLVPLASMVEDICTVIRYDQRGSGRSQHIGPYDVQTHIDDLEALRRKLNITSWIVGGHSWGASLALAYSTQFTEHTTALVYVSGTGINPHWHNLYQHNCLEALSEDEKEKWQQLYVRLAQSRGDEYDKIRQELQLLTNKTDVADPVNIDKVPTFKTNLISNKANELINIDWGIYMVQPEFVESIKHLPVAALFIHGTQDPRSILFIEELAGYVPDSTFIPIPKVGHYPYIEQPEQTKAALRGFIEEKIQIDS